MIWIVLIVQTDCFLMIFEDKSNRICKFVYHFYNMAKIMNRKTLAVLEMKIEVTNQQSSVQINKINFKTIKSKDGNDRCNLKLESE